jgi:hypothetical protein
MSLEIEEKLNEYKTKNNGHMDPEKERFIRAIGSVIPRVTSLGLLFEEDFDICWNRTCVTISGQSNHIYVSDFSSGEQEYRRFTDPQRAIEFLHQNRKK